eukprot:g6253.t1
MRHDCWESWGGLEGYQAETSVAGCARESGVAEAGWAWRGTIAGDTKAETPPALDHAAGGGGDTGNDNEDGKKKSNTNSEGGGQGKGKGKSKSKIEGKGKAEGKGRGKSGGKGKGKGNGKGKGKGKGNGNGNGKGKGKGKGKGNGKGNGKGKGKGWANAAASILTPAVRGPTRQDETAMSAKRAAATTTIPSAGALQVVSQAK